MMFNSGCTRHRTVPLWIPCLAHHLCGLFDALPSHSDRGFEAAAPGSV